MTMRGVAGQAKALATSVARAGAWRRSRPGGLAGLGDSITAGTGAARTMLLPRDSWLTHAVIAGTRYTFNGGVPNQTTQDILNRLPEVLAHRPRVLGVVAGVNDVYERRSGSEAVERIGAMVEGARSGGAEPFIATIMPVPGLVDVAHELNTHVHDLAGRESVELVDFHAVVCAECGGDSTLLRDGLHPNERGARALAGVAVPTVRRLMAPA